MFHTKIPFCDTFGKCCYLTENPILFYFLNLISVSPSSASAVTLSRTLQEFGQYTWNNNSLQDKNMLNKKLLRMTSIAGK